MQAAAGYCADCADSSIGIQLIGQQILTKPASACGSYLSQCVYVATDTNTTADYQRTRIAVDAYRAVAEIEIAKLACTIHITVDAFKRIEYVGHTWLDVVEIYESTGAVLPTHERMVIVDIVIVYYNTAIITIVAGQRLRITIGAANFDGWTFNAGGIAVDYRGVTSDKQVAIDAHVTDK